MALLCYIHIDTHYFIFLSWRLRDSCVQSPSCCKREFHAASQIEICTSEYSSCPTGKSTEMVSDLNVFTLASGIHLLLANAVVTLCPSILYLHL